MSNFNNLDEILEVANAYAANKVDFEAKLSQMRIEDDQLLVPSTGLFQAMTPLGMEEHAWRQLFGKLGPAHFGKGAQKMLPFDFIMADKIDRRARNVSEIMAQSADKNASFIRGYTEGGKTVCRAVLSDRFTVIDNHTMLARIANELKGKNLPEFRVAGGTSITRDDMHIKTVWKNKEGDDGQGWGAGCVFYNGETGKTGIGCAALIKRTSCDNSIVIDVDSNYKKRHVGDARIHYAGIFGAMAVALKESFAWIDKMIEAEHIEVPDFMNLLSNLCLEYGWEGKQRDAVFAGTEGAQTIGSAINGVTYMAHAVEMDPAEQFRIESIGGAILVDDNNIFAKAARRERVNVR